MDNVESAEAAGDHFPTTQVLTADGVVSLIGCLMGNPFINAVYIGHPGWKAMGGRIGYSAATGAMVIVLCWFGIVSVLLAAIPVVASLLKVDVSGGKVEPHEIASKTQMFTERYMVDWLLQNSVGPLWLAMCKKHGYEHRDIARWRDRKQYDLVICQGVLQYLSDSDVSPAVSNIASMAKGLVYFEVLTRADLRERADLDRTDADVYVRNGSYYRGLFAKHFIAVGGGGPGDQSSGFQRAAELRRRLIDERVALSGLEARRVVLTQRVGEYEGQLRTLPRRA